MEAAYVGWFFDQGIRCRGADPELRAALGDRFARPGALAAALAIYRTLPDSARQLVEATRDGQRLTVPTATVGAQPVGRTLENQLRGVTDHLTGHLVEDCGHIVPVDRPDALIDLIREPGSVR